MADHHIRVRRGDGPVRGDVGRGLQHVPAQLAEHLSLVRYAARQHHIEGTDAVAGHQHGAAILQVVHVAHLAVVDLATGSFRSERINVPA